MALSKKVIIEKNKIGSDEPFLIALEITLPGIADKVRVIRNTDDIIWRGDTYYAVPFEISELSDSSTDEVPSVTISISNVDYIVGSYVAEYDSYCKKYGMKPVDINIYVLSTVDLDNDDPVVAYTLMLVQPSINAETVTFTLGAPNPFIKRFPLQRLLKDHCRFRFKSPLCGYTGVETTCNKSLAQCRAYGNNTRFGGYPGIGTGGLTFAESS